MVDTKSIPDIGAFIEAAKPFAKCNRSWETKGYSILYTCLDREIDIARPDHHTTDWWPYPGPCEGCILSKTLGKTGNGTLTTKEQAQKLAEEKDRREYERLKAKYG